MSSYRESCESEAGTDSSPGNLTDRHAEGESEG